MEKRKRVQLVKLVYLLLFLYGFDVNQAKRILGIIVVKIIEQI